MVRWKSTRKGTGTSSIASTPKDQDDDDDDDGNDDENAPESSNKKKKKKKGKDTLGSETGAETLNRQRAEWIQFQQDISVGAFDTGQTTDMKGAFGEASKSRGGKDRRRRKERQFEARLEEVSSNEALGSGLYPAIRYSDEETQRLLEQAYAALPKRTGKRRTRYLKRQRQRWEKVEAIHSKQKAHVMAAHERRMAKRSRIASQVKDVKRTAAQYRARDARYQEEVARQWIAMEQQRLSGAGQKGGE